jgi:endonuclease/exonuclease/phosphatase family metal-dependent hydrolase
VIVATWNVLHRVHAVNWGEPPAAKGEPARIEAIASAVDALLAFSVAVCLQEVSGDQLRALRARHVFRLAYPRVPRAKAGRVELDDPTEHLVVLSSALPGEVIRARVFPEDPGKGFLSVRLGGGLVVVSTHVSFGAKREAQLAELAAHAREHAGQPVVIGGDWNADAATVMAALGDGFTCAALPPGRRTRPRADDASKSQDIDHVIGHFTAASEAGVEDGRGLSDHNPVWAKFV